MRSFLVFILFAISLMASGGIARVVSISGEVHVYRGNMLMLFKEGMELKREDTIESKKNGRATIIFYDETIVTIGSNTNFTIAKYLDSEQNAAMELEPKEGVLRVITGKIGKIAPQNFKIKTRTITIGVRGTQFILTIDGTKEQYFCTEGKISLALRKAQSDLIVSDLIRSPFNAHKHNQKEFAPIYILHAGDMAEFVKPAPKPNQTQPKISTTQLSSINAKRPNIQEAQTISSALQDGYGVVASEVAIINQYQEIMDLPPKDPIIIRELNDPNPSKLQTPSLQEITSPDDLLNEIMPVDNK